MRSWMIVWFLISLLVGDLAVAMGFYQIYHELSDVYEDWKL